MQNAKRRGRWKREQARKPYFLNTAGNLSAVVTTVLRIDLALIERSQPGNHYQRAAVSISKSSGKCTLSKDSVDKNLGLKTHRKAPRYEQKRETPHQKQNANYDARSGTPAQKKNLEKGWAADNAAQKGSDPIRARLQKRDMPGKTQRDEDAGGGNRGGNHNF